MFLVEIFFANSDVFDAKEYGTLTNWVVPVIEKLTPPVGSVSVFKNYVPPPQFISDIIPVALVPPPIIKLTNPLIFVCKRCVSE